MRNWKINEDKGAEVIKKVNYAMELAKMSQEEFYKVLKIFRDIEFANGKAITMLFGHKLLDLKGEEELVTEVVKEYQEGAIDPVKKGFYRKKAMV